MALLNVARAEEIDYENNIIDNGYLVKARIKEIEVKDSQQNTANKFLGVEYVVTEGRFAGATFYDNIGIKGSEGFVKLGSSKLKAILEVGKSARIEKDYDIDSWNNLKGLEALIQVKQEFYTNKNGEQKIKNSAAKYGSSRLDSSRYNLYDEYMKGNQPFVVDNLVLSKSSNSYNSNYDPNHPAFSNDIPL